MMRAPPRALAPKLFSVAVLALLSVSMGYLAGRFELLERSSTSIIAPPSRSPG